MRELKITHKLYPANVHYCVDEYIDDEFVESVAGGYIPTSGDDWCAYSGDVGQAVNDVLYRLDEQIINDPGLELEGLIDLIDTVHGVYDSYRDAHGDGMVSEMYLDTALDGLDHQQYHIPQRVCNKIIEHFAPQQTNTTE